MLITLFYVKMIVIVFYLFRNTRIYTLISCPYIAHFLAVVAMNQKDLSKHSVQIADDNNNARIEWNLLFPNNLYEVYEK